MIFTLLGLLLFAGLLYVLGSQLYVRSLDTPPYRVADPQPTDYQIRQYAPYLVAQTEVPLSDGDHLNEGFRRLAGYIFGGNAGPDGQPQPIAMTTPVLDQAAPTAGSDTRTVIFSLPPQWRLDSVPTPDDPRVEVVEHPGGRFAVFTYSGARQATTDQAIQTFTTALIRDGHLTPDTAPSAQFDFAYYDPPSTLPALRRNEILFRLPPTP